MAHYSPVMRPVPPWVTPVHGAVTVHLLGGPWITVGQAQSEIPEGGMRLLAFLSLDRRPLDRHYIAGSLWPDSDDERAGGCLRTSLWLLRQAGLDIIECSKVTLRLLAEVRVDAEVAIQWADRVLAGRATSGDLTVRPDDALDLLPGWYDDWVLLHRERLRQRVLHALDELSAVLRTRGDHAGAVEAAGSAVAAEPLRESAQRALVRAHLAEGNLVEARRAFGRYEKLLHRELGISPSPDLYGQVGLPSFATGLGTVRVKAGERLRN